MGNIHPDIKPNGLNQKDLVNLLYQIVASLKGICAKLDDDGGVTDTTYEANCYTAIFNIIIEDCLSNRTGITGNYIINPYGVSDPALLELLYQIFDSIETLTEQLDADDGVTDTDHEALCYTAILTQNVTNQTGNTLGNGTSYYFRPGGVTPQRELVDCLYNFVNSIETLTEQLDAGDGVTDTNYEALWFTATVLTKVQNSAGNVLGN